MYTISCSRMQRHQCISTVHRFHRCRNYPIIIHSHFILIQHFHCSALSFALSLPQDSAPGQSRDHAGNCSLFVNEAAFAGTSVNNRHVHHKRNDPSAHNCLNSLLARSNSRQTPTAKTPHSPHSDPQGWVMGTGYLYSPAGRLELQHTASGKYYHRVDVSSSVKEGKLKQITN